MRERRLIWSDEIALGWLSHWYDTELGVVEPAVAARIRKTSFGVFRVQGAPLRLLPGQPLMLLGFRPHGVLAVVSNVHN